MRFSKPDSAAYRTRALGRLKPGEMNKSEAAYAGHLELRRVAGEVLWYSFEPLTLKLAKDTRLTVDFMVMLADRSIEFHDVKGNWFQDDAKVKVKVAAAKFPMFRFVVVRPLAKKHGGGWSEEEF